VPTAMEGAVVRRLFGASTFTKGWSYASRGSVLDCSHDPDEDVVSGAVQGQARSPYDVVVRLSRSASGALAGIEGDCSCPMAYNCKHVAALVLASGAIHNPSAGPDRSCPELSPRAGPVRSAAGPARRPPPTGSGRPRGWEKPLVELIGATAGRGRAADPAVALQFEKGARRRIGRSRTPTTGIRVRPVARSHNGNWVRTGVSWSKLQYGYVSGGAPAEVLRLLREIYLVSCLSGPLGYGGYTSYHADSEVWLESFSSRRLWDLLEEAEDLGVPLVQSGVRSGAVRRRPEPAAVRADLVAVGDGLELTPYLDASGETVPPESSLLIGSPPHGVAWWTGLGSESDPQLLSLAPFGRSLQPGEVSLIGSQPLRVPARDRLRFMRDFYPRLARSVDVASSDDSVELPDVARSVLVLSVHHHAQRSLVRWQRGIEGAAGWRDDLWDASAPGLERDVDLAVTQATELCRRLPALMEQAWTGERLASSAELAGMGAVRFVKEVLPALGRVPGLVVEEEGEPPDYREARAAPVVSLRPAAGSGGRAVDGDWFDLMIEVSVDGEEVVFQALFLALAEGQSHLVLPSGTYFPLDRPELAELADLIADARAMQDRESAAPDRIRLSRFQAGLWEDLGRLGVVTAQAEAWEEAVRALAQGGDSAAVDPPDGLEATLRSYQHEGFAWLAFLYGQGLGGILADDMGLGKTLQALSLVGHARQAMGVEEPFLVVAPTSVVENWASECRRFIPGLRAVTVSETQARRWVSLADLADKADLVITSYTLFRLEYEDYAGVAWAGVFLDEAQFVKNPRAIAHQRAKALPAPFKLAMTGTPIENNLKELWALLSITAPGLFPRSDHFAERYGVPIEKGGDAERLAQLRRRIRPLMLRRTKDQVESELPDKQEQILELELAPKHRRLYQTHLQRERQKILGLLGDMNRNQFEILRSLTILRQAALDISLVDPSRQGVPSTKLDVLSEMLEEVVADGHRVLVFSQFTRFLRAAANRAGSAGIEHCYLDGRTRRRDKVIAAFRDGDAPVFFISLKAGGFGLNLTEADYCILLDPWWNPATEAQAVDRTHRIGQTRKVMVYRFVSKDTIEEKVMALKAKKSVLFANVMDGGGFEHASLSAADIRALVD
jgi:hypothetical protein